MSKTIEPLAASTARPESRALTGAEIAIGGFGVFLVLWWLAQPATADLEMQARQACIGAIMAKLNDPGSASFEAPSITKVGANHQVRFTLRAKNAFGGVITSAASCSVGPDGAVRSVSIS